MQLSPISLAITRLGQAPDPNAAIKALFAAGEQGAWYDPSDFSTMFQDAAGTMPVTAVEQPVGLILDKSGRGNHASQSTTTKRPILRARHNLLTYSEQFDNAVWVKSQVNVSADVGGVADKLIPTITSAPHSLSHNNEPVTGSQTWFIEAKAAGLNKVSLREGITSGAYVTFSLIDGSVISFGNGANVYGSVDLGDGWFRLYLVHNPAGNFGRKINLVPDSYTAGDPNNVVFSGDGTSGVLVRAAQCNYGATALPYQRIAAATDYDTVGFPHADVFDGADDNQVSSAGGGATTAFFWCSSIKVGKVGAVQTLFSDTGTNTGYRVRINASNQLELAAGNGSAYTTATTSDALSLGQSAVLTAWHDGVNLNVQINNGTVVQAAFVTATAGTAQITVGSDNNVASSYFMGSLYEAVYLKDTVVSAANISATKDHCANKGKITL